MTVRTGLEILLADPAPIGGRRWALLANQASVTRNLEAARIALATAASKPTRLFAPEHGYDGVAQDMEAVADGVDVLTGAAVHSLYGRDAASLAPRDEDLEGIEAVVVDLPDIGARYYTFAASLDGMMSACERAGVEVIVLDRPNPIGGTAREGGLVRPGFESFVSQLPTPIRHGLTLGEIALLLHRERVPDLELTVIRCVGWEREDFFDSTGLPWVPPSPNMPTLDTAILYPGLCLVEATNLSEGRGTTRPFHLVGAPWIDGPTWVNALRDLDLPGVAFRATSFRPEFQKHAGEICRGCELHIVDRHRLRPLELGMEMLRAAHDLWPKAFDWRADPYEFVSDVPALDLLTGSPDARVRIEEGRDLRHLFASWREEVRAFETALENILLY